MWLFMLDLDAPRDLQTVELTDESISLEWKNSHAQADSYRIKYGPLSGGEHGELLFPRGPKDTTQAKITGAATQQTQQLNTWWTSLYVGLFITTITFTDSGTLAKSNCTSFSTFLFP